MARENPIINVDALEWTPIKHGERFDALRKGFTAPAGGEKLGCSLYRLPPGKAAFPAHFHHANEEALYVLAGQGTLRLGGQEHPLRQGDYVALPAGRPEAHQVRNTSDAPLEYLCFSTMIVPEIAEYPDSGKVGVMAGTAPGGDRAVRKFLAVYKRDSAVGYYDDE